jgi:nitroimidazol reductase NimA-like FMN-containing flavoprotein (pyridoxamine 5'-phosphate oxidase superfamily)
MDLEAIHSLLTTAPLCRVGTTRGKRPHVTPMWFVWDREALWLYSIVQSKRWRDVDANPLVSVVVDIGATFDDYRGVEVLGPAVTVGGVPRTPEYDRRLSEVECAFALKYNSKPELEIDGRHAWLRLQPTHMISWDFARLSARRRASTPAD